MRPKMTPLDAQMDEVRLDQSVVDWTLDHFDFDLASKLVAIYTEQDALANKRDPATVYRPSAEEMRKRAAEIVLKCLHGGREHGVGFEIHAAYMKARYEHFEILETVDLELCLVKGHGMRPKSEYLKSIRAYIDAMGGGWLDEDGRWQPGEPPEMRQASQ